MPDENSLDAKVSRMPELLLPFGAKEIARVIRSSAIAAMNLALDRCLPYRSESREFLRSVEEVECVRM
jgi:hypothetical protein